MTNLSKQVSTLTAQELKEGFESGLWVFCRDEFYIRQGVDRDSVEDKMRALVEITDKTANTGIVKVLEPFLVNQYVNEDGHTVNEIMSGNTRTRAVLELQAMSPPKVTFGEGKEAYTINITEFAPIPYRVYEETIGLEEAIDIQTSTNDHTKKHNPLDVAIKAFQLKPILEQKYIEQGIKPKQAGGKATDYLCKLFKRSKQNLTQYFSVIGKGSATLHQFVHSGKMSMDTAATIIQKLDNPTSEQVDNALTELWNIARTVASSSGIKPEQAIIYKSQVINYFTDKKNAEAAASGDDDSSGGGADDSGKGGKGGGAKEPEPEVDRDKFVDDFTAIYTRVYNMTPDACTLDNAKDLDALNNAMLRTLIKTSGLNLPTETAIDEYAVIRELWLRRYEDVEKLADTIADKEDVKYSDVLKTVNYASKPLANIKKKNEPESEPAATKPGVSASSEEIEVNADNGGMTVLGLGNNVTPPPEEGGF